MAPDPRRSLPADPPAQLLTALAKIGLALRSGAWRQAWASEMTPTQVQILLLLRARGPHRIGAIAEGLGVSDPTASVAVKTLVAKRLVLGEPDPADARARRIGLTAMGRRAADRLGGWPEALAEAVDSLPPADQAAMLRAMMQVIRTLQRRGEIPVSRMCVTCRFFRPDAHPQDAERPHHCAFVDAPFGDRALRLDCADHQPVAGAGDAA
ncbi:MAG TPA: MarR family winged helix-turn-helix transcriptional regulator [Gemmatimonadales bacterium]|nr:MarR family winged helix-turn-helix transcriptional regulator [Gemmatimonadales bacterium]